MNSPTRVAYLSYDGLTDPLGQSQILPYVLGLEAQGFEFVIISFEKREIYNDGKRNIEASLSGKKVTWIPLTYHKNPPVLSTVLDIYYLWRAVRQEHKLKPIQIIHCRSYITALVGLRMKRQTGTKFLFDMRGFWADERVEGGLWNLRNPLYQMIYKFFKRKENQFFVEADHIISLTENAKQEIASWGLSIAPITVIPTCVDLELFNPEKIQKEDQEKLRAQLGISPDDFVLLYLGSWGTWYLTKQMLDFFSELKKQKPGTKFLIVSGDKIDLMDFEYQQDVIITRAPRHLVPLHISLAAASVFFIKPSFSKKASSATKMGEIMALGVSIITNRGWGDVERIIKEDNGVLLSEFTETAFIKAITKINFMPLTKEIPNELPEQLSLSFGVSAYLQVVKRLLP